MSVEMTLYYSPEKINDAVREHIERNLKLNGNMRITYTHKRKTKEVSAEIHILNQDPWALTQTQTDFTKPETVYQPLEDPLLSISDKPAGKLSEPKKAVAEKVDHTAKAFDNTAESVEESDTLFGE